MGFDLFHEKLLLLSENRRTEHFYAPQVAAQETFLKQHGGSKTAEEFTANQRHEDQLFGKYKAYYSYVFYIGKKL